LSNRVAALRRLRNVRRYEAKCRWIEFNILREFVRTCEEHRYKFRLARAISRRPVPAFRKWARKQRLVWCTASCRCFRRAFVERFCGRRASVVPSVWTRICHKRSGFVPRNFARRDRRPLFVERANRIKHSGQSRFLFREFTGALIGTQQISTFHEGEPGAALAIASNLASRANRKMALANAANPFELGRVIPDIIESLAPQISCRLRQLDARKDIAIRRNVAAIVARAARQIFVRRVFDSAANRAAQRVRRRAAACRRATQYPATPEAARKPMRGAPAAHRNHPSWA
jgi:hypothetical protein